MKKHNPFQVPLSTQRYVEVYNVLNQHNCTKLLDLGSGAGSLLLEQLLKPPISLDDDALRLAHYHALDSDLAELDALSRLLASHRDATLRWSTDLTLRLYHADFAATFHPAFRALDAIVAVEVLEHMQESVLAQTMQLILGTYSPPLFIATTPNYDFNPRFTSPARVVDPTGRTDRLFRHPDHKFELGVREYTQWCAHYARLFGYNVSVYGVGESIAQNLNPPSTDPRVDDRYPSQIAVFKRVRCAGRINTENTANTEESDLTQPTQLPPLHSSYTLPSAAEHLSRSSKLNAGIPGTPGTPGTPNAHAILTHLYSLLDLPFGGSRVVVASALSLWDTHMQLLCRGVFATLLDAVRNSGKYGGEVSTLDVDGVREHSSQLSEHSNHSNHSQHSQHSGDAWFILAKNSSDTPSIVYRQSVTDVLHADTLAAEMRDKRKTPKDKERERQQEEKQVDERLEFEKEQLVENSEYGSSPTHSSSCLSDRYGDTDAVLANLQLNLWKADPVWSQDAANAADGSNAGWGDADANPTWS
ncbi:hypothetical protein E3P77_02550 [Wallemia ichthyophaga]|nr:hypothetical protein E3P77_02550 [Wallemia ichthyophaga]